MPSSKRTTFALTLSLFTASVASAAPRDDVLRLAPSDAAVVIVVQNARTHYHYLVDSPFVRWLPSTAIGKKLMESADLKQLRESVGMIFTELGTTPAELLDDVLGEAFAFAFTPASQDKTTEERSVLVVRPRKVDVLAKLVARMNELQTRSGEVKEVIRKDHGGAAYHERQKPGGSADYYCFRGDVFLFSSSEAELKACIDRDKTAPPASDKPPELLQRLTKLGVADSAGAILINPRALDGEVKAKVAAAKADERRFLTRFAEVWAALDFAAVHISLDRDLEAGVSLRFQTAKLPADVRKLLTGPRSGLAERLIPKEALFGVAGQLHATELIELIASLTPLEPGKADVKKWIADTLGPIVGKDKLPAVLNALGPNWAVWAEPPAGNEPLPVFVAALELRGEGDTRIQTEKSVLDALEFGFKTARVAYNATHVDQIDVKEEKDPRSNAAITSLVNDKGFPPGFRPSFAIVRGYLLVATSPDAIKRFEPPSVAPPLAKGSRTVARLSGTASRAYLLAHGPQLAKFLADLGVGPEKTLVEQLANLADVLELIDSARIVLRGDDSGLTIAAHIVFAKPLK